MFCELKTIKTYIAAPAAIETKLASFTSKTKLRRTKLQAEQDQTFIELLVANLSAKNWKLVNCIKIDVKKDLLGVIP